MQITLIQENGLNSYQYINRGAKMFVKCPECGNEFFQEKVDEGSLKYVYCEKCGAFINFCGKCDEMLITKIEGMCIGQYCPKCKEWVMVTTYIPPKK